MEKSPAIAWIADTRGRLHYLNEAGKKWIAPDKWPVPDACSLLPPKLAAHGRKMLRQLAAGYSPYASTITLPLPGGATTSFDLFAFALAFNPRKTLWAGWATNIDTLTQTRTHLSAIIERYALTAKATSDALYDWNIKDNTIYRGDGFETRFGYPPAPLPGSFAWTLIHPADRRKTKMSLLRRLQSSSDHWQAEYRFRCSDGAYRPVLDKAFIVRDKKGRALRVIGAMQDLSEKKALEEKLQAEEHKAKQDILRAIVEAQEKERRELSRELHDNVNQLLGFAKLMADALLHDPTLNLQQSLQKIGEAMKQAMTETRRISHNLNPGPAEELNLYPALRAMAAAYSASGQLRVRCRLQHGGPAGGPSLPPDLSLALYRIAQEGLNNIVKHAGASLAAISFTGKENIVLTISDNGRGFNPAGVEKGLGLRNIHNRVELYGGTLHLRSAPGKGCTIKISISLPPQKE